MGINLNLIDLNSRLINSGNVPIILNDFKINNIRERERLNNLLCVNYDNNSLSIQPSCDCRAISGEYNIGIVCGKCNVEVQRLTEKSLEPVLWLRVPDKVDRFISPQVWNIFSSKFRDALHYICFPRELIEQNKKIGKIEKLALLLEQRNIKRGINSFYRNFDEIIEIIEECRFVVPKRSWEVLKEFINKNRDKIFTEYLPIPSRLTFVVESTVTAVYTDPTMFYVLDAVRTITSIVDPIIPIESSLMLENKAAKANRALAEYYSAFCKLSLNPKPGWFRKHLYGTKSYFTFRAVITSISNRHDYDEVHLPWSIGIMGYRLHLTNKLLKRGFTPNTATAFLNEHCEKYHPLIEELFKELIKESKFKGLPVIIQRNPTLMRGSAQLLYITKIETDPSIKSMAISVLILKAYNADFDGDTLNGLIVLDNKYVEILSRLKPHLGVLDLKEPYKISKNLTIPPPVISTINNWINEDV